MSYDPNGQGQGRLAAEQIGPLFETKLDGPASRKNLGLEGPVGVLGVWDNTVETAYKVYICPRGNLLYMRIYFITDLKLF